MTATPPAGGGPPVRATLARRPCVRPPRKRCAPWSATRTPPSGTGSGTPSRGWCSSGNGSWWFSGPVGASPRSTSSPPALLRDAGAGPTLIVSPLLALMRDQVAAAARAGIRALTMNSANAQEWDDVTAALAADDGDVLLVSPERLNNPRFRDRAAADAGGPVRAAGRRRGPLRQRLGARLPPRLPPDPRPARPTSHRDTRSWRPRRPPTRGWSPTSPSSSPPAATR